jgi:hypothetical protein
LLFTLLAARIAMADAGPAASRVASDAAALTPLVAHVVVALCDNQNQGIVPVPASLGNGQVPGTNLYWGAAYGLRGFLPRHAGWRLVEERRAPRDGVLERVVLRTQSGAGGRTRDLYIVAEAWDGARMRDAIGRFLSIAAGGETESLRVDRGRVALAAGGASHLAVFVGHDGLMDFALEQVPHVVPGAPPRCSVVLACASRSYFLDALRAGGSCPLLLTTGLMAPEAYTLDAVVRTWLGGATPAEVREAAAAAYDRYQRCGISAARRLFSAEP